MHRISLESPERYDTPKWSRELVFDGERLKTLLLCLTAGQAAPSHRREDFGVMLQPFRWVAEISLDEEAVTLRAGEAILLNGKNDFAPTNQSEDEFAMPITLVWK